MKIKTGFEMRDICGEKVIVAQGIENIDFDKLISLNDSAAFLWEKMAQMEAFDERTLTNLLLEEYDVKEEDALEDVKKLVSTWKELGIIE